MKKSDKSASQSASGNNRTNDDQWHHRGIKSIGRRRWHGGKRGDRRGNGVTARCIRAPAAAHRAACCHLSYLAVLLRTLPSPTYTASLAPTPARLPACARHCATRIRTLRSARLSREKQ